MLRLKGLKNHRLKLVICGLLVLFWLVLGPVAGWLWPGNWWGTNLIVLMNENEARPCGGFVTAYGVAKLPFGPKGLQNSFAFPPVSLGENSLPLRQVAVERKFWDLGDTLDLATCAEQFADAYTLAEDQAPTRVILVQAGVIEAWLAALGPVKTGEYTLDEHNFFATTSRLVADIDRHDEAALAARKNPLSSFGKSLITRTILRPWRWPGVSRAFGRAQQNQTLYWHKVDDPAEAAWQQQRDQLITITEWNLGGGKSSRYLDKAWNLTLQQRTPELWEAEVTLTAKHLGGHDEPLSQTWKGGFEIGLFQGNPEFVSAEIAPGETFTHTLTAPIGTRGLQSSPIDPYTVWLYAPPYQNWHTTMSVSALGQQNIEPESTSLAVQENTAVWRGGLNPSGHRFNWRLEPDNTLPFLTWHKPLSSRSLSAKDRLALQHGQNDIIVEVHFNEPIKLLGRTPQPSGDDNLIFRGDDLSIRLIDRDHTVPAHTEDPIVESALLYADKQTLLLNVGQNQFQKDERFYLEIDAVADQWGGQTNLKGRTVITR